MKFSTNLENDLKSTRKTQNEQQKRGTTRKRTKVQQNQTTKRTNESGPTNVLNISFKKVYDQSVLLFRPQFKVSNEIVSINQTHVQRLRILIMLQNCIATN